MLSDLINSLDIFDRELTLVINSWNNSFFDHFFYFFTQTWVWIPLAFMLVILMWHQWGCKSLYLLLAFVLVILISDQLSSSVIKPLFERPRPTHNPAIADIIHTVNGYRGGAYGFVSSHAANSIAFVLLASIFFRRKLFTVAFTSWAFITAYSRIYLGVHYLGDVLFGALVGIFSALLVYKIFGIIIKHIPESKYSFPLQKLAHSSNILMVCILLLTVTVIFISGLFVNIL